MQSAIGLPPRLSSLDQFRGYSVLAMFVAALAGSLHAVSQHWPLVCRQTTYLSLADTILPQFLLAAGFAYRMSFLRRLEKDGSRAAYAHALKRAVGLVLVALAIGQFDVRFDSWQAVQKQGPLGLALAACGQTFFQGLVQIALTSLWVLPVISARAGRRIVFAFASAALFHLASQYGYYQWLLAGHWTDGGPLGFLTWTIPLLVGTLAYDSLCAHVDPLTAREDGTPPNLVDAAGQMIFWGIFLMVLGYGLACLNRGTIPNHFSAAEGWRGMLVEPPFVAPSEPVNVWTMSQAAGSASGMTFAAGWSLGLFALFVLASDVAGLSLGIFRTLGSNPLASTIVCALGLAAFARLVPQDSPTWYIAAALTALLATAYLMIRHLEKHRLLLKL